VTKLSTTTPDLLKQLATTVNPSPPKTKKKRTARKIKQKKQIRKKVVKINDTTDLTVVAKAMIHEGGTVADVGVILACQQAEGGEEWLAGLKAQGLSIEEFIQAAKQRADIELVRVAARTALGYTYEEGSQEFMPEMDEEGEPTGKFIPGKKKVLEKHVRDTALLWNLMKSRMPEFFSDVKHLEISKRTVELKMDAESEIKGFAAGLLKAFDEPIDVEFEESTL